jgi:hypothetical protein
MDAEIIKNPLRSRISGISGVPEKTGGPETFCAARFRQRWATWPTSWNPASWKILHVALNRLHYAGISLSAPHSIVIITGGSATTAGLRAFILDLVELPVENIGFANLPQGMSIWPKLPFFFGRRSDDVCDAVQLFRACTAHGSAPRGTEKIQFFQKVGDFWAVFLTDCKEEILGCLRSSSSTSTMRKAKGSRNGAPIERRNEMPYTLDEKMTARSPNKIIGCRRRGRQCRQQP